MSIRENILSQALSYCKTYNVSHRAFCLSAGVDKRVLHKIERGENVSLATLELIEKYLLKLSHEGKLPRRSPSVMGKASVSFPIPSALSFSISDCFQGEVSGPSGYSGAKPSFAVAPEGLAK